MPELARWVQVRNVVRRSVRLGLRNKGHHYDGFDAGVKTRGASNQGHSRTPAKGSRCSTWPTLPFGSAAPVLPSLSHESKTRVGGISGSSPTLTRRSIFRAAAIPPVRTTSFSPEINHQLIRRLTLRPSHTKGGDAAGSRKPNSLDTLRSWA